MVRSQGELTRKPPGNNTMKQILKSLIGLTYNEAETLWRRGDMSDLVWRAWREVWTWSTSRFSNVNNADWKQTQFWDRHGKEAFYKRIQKTRLAFGLAPINPSPFTSDKQ